MCGEHSDLHHRQMQPHRLDGCEQRRDADGAKGGYLLIGTFAGARGFEGLGRDVLLGGDERVVHSGVECG